MKRNVKMQGMFALLPRAFFFLKKKSSYALSNKHMQLYLKKMEV